MEQPPENVRRFFEDRAEALTGDVWRVIGQGMELEELPAPDDFDPLPASVLEACGYYYFNVMRRDNGSVYVFRADAGGTPVYGVLTTSDGGDYWLEVYAADGALLGAARMDSGFILWRDREEVRRKSWDGGLEPELLAARQRRMGK
jgi:hypothetical protein